METKIIALANRPDIEGDIKASRIYNQFAALLIELDKSPLTPDIIATINTAVEEINASPGTAIQLSKLVKQKQTIILNK